MKTTNSTSIRQLGMGLDLSTKKTRKAKVLEEMEGVVPWPALVGLAPAKRTTSGHDVCKLNANRAPALPAQIIACLSGPLGRQIPIDVGLFLGPHARSGILRSQSGFARGFAEYF